MTDAPLFSLAADWAKACLDTDPRDIWPQDQRRIDAARVAFLECVETVQRGLAGNLGIVQVAVAALHAKQEAPTAFDGAGVSPAGSPKESGTDEKEVSALLTPLEPRPLYFVRDIDGSYHEADPQP